MRINRTLPLAAALATGVFAADPAPQATFRKYCVQCHGKAASGGINLEQLTAAPAFGEQFQQWRRVATALEERRMPPPNTPQPPDADRAGAARWVRASLDEYARKHNGDPGRVTMRRLTSAEYVNSIRDLTGLDLRLERELADDSVGGEGFTNYGDVQVMGDANLERYLRAAKLVADHAVIGTGPLEFYRDPGKSGLELSAIHRIQDIYTTYGFRSSSAEGGRPYGLHRYSKAMFACWRYQNRQALGEPNATLDSLAAKEHVPARFVQHVWTVLRQPQAPYPTSDVIARWNRIAKPTAANREQSSRAALEECVAIQRFLIDWSRALLGAGELAEGGQGDERSLVVTDETVQAEPSQRIRTGARVRNQKVRLYLTVASVNPVSKDAPVVLWKNPVLRAGRRDRSGGGEQTLRSVLDAESLKRLGFVGDSNEFTLSGDTTVPVDLPAPKDSPFIGFTVEAQLVRGPVGDAVVRVTVSDEPELSKGRPTSMLLGDPKSAGYKAWKAGVLNFASQLPLVSHGEPNPADRDPIPPPYDNNYNQPERDSFHTKVKFYRTDRFLMDKMLDDSSRARLDRAWLDLFASTDYHHQFLTFVNGKFNLGLDTDIARLTATQVAAVPAEPRQHVKALHDEYNGVQKALAAASPGHIEDCLRFASRAWRRPLTPQEKDALRGFYTTAREQAKLDHTKAVRLLLARVLTSPSFLYRAEQSTLTPHDLASRISYFLWSSPPDDELRRAADSGELSNPQQSARQVKRMLADPRARRFATEFFGQWLGFYRFDQYTGVDTGRFPEFTEDLRKSMYEEAISFFEHIVRQERPVRDVLFADYAFLDPALAKHYGVGREIKGDMQLVQGAQQFHRGGMLGLGAVLTATSAPLRTSPVKRGDWLLRRILGTPTPPPPADVGSIPADDKAFGGQSLRERLESHKRNATCAACHNKIDPLGFPLESYDAVGRWREAYPDGKPVHEPGAQRVDGLLQYLKEREGQVVETMARKLVGYALGRTVQASDQPLVDRMVKAGGGATFSQLAAEIVASRQFRTRRDEERTITAHAGNRN